MTWLRVLAISCLIPFGAGIVRAGEAEDAMAAGQAALKKNDPDAALASFTKAITLKPRDPALYYYRALVYAQKGDWANVIADSTTSLALNPGAPGNYFNRAFAYANLKALDKAFTDANMAVKLDPKYAAAYCLRGRIFEEQGDTDNALADYNLTLQFDPNYYYAFIARAHLHQNRGDTAEAARDFGAALRINADDPEVLNDIAWDLATCPDEAVRNGAKSLRYALKACDLTNWKNASYLDTLAAAYAEIGDFEQAVKWQRKAVDLLPKGEHADELAAHLQLYLKNQPYHEPAKTKSDPAAPAVVPPVPAPAPAGIRM